MTGVPTWVSGIHRQVGAGAQQMRDYHAGPHGEGLDDVTHDHEELALAGLVDEVDGFVVALTSCMLPRLSDTRL
jgi:hypothetical protein